MRYYKITGCLVEINNNTPQLGSDSTIVNSFEEATFYVNDRIKEILDLNFEFITEFNITNKFEDKDVQVSILTYKRNLDGEIISGYGEWQIYETEIEIDENNKIFENSFGLSLD